MSWYRAGSVSVTNGSWFVVGTAVDFIANASIGDAFQGPDGRSYEIAEIQSGAQIRLISGYQGSTASNQAYAIQPTSSFARDLATAVGQLISSYSSVRDGVGQGLFPDGSNASPALRFLADQDTGISRAGDNALAVVLGGIQKYVFTTSGLRSYADENGQVIDIVGNSQSAAQIRFLNNAFSAALLTIGFVPGYGTQISALAGGMRLSAADGSGVYTRVGSADITVTNANSFNPIGDNMVALGLSSNRWSYVAAASGTIVTSDERTKAWRGALNDDELAAAKAIAASIGVYQLNDAIADKGAAHARLHVGIKAQHVWQIMADHGLVDPITAQQSSSRYAFLTYEQWDAIEATPDIPATPDTPAKPAVFDGAGNMVQPPAPAVPGTPAIKGTPARSAGELYGVRPDELLMFVSAAQEQRLLDQERRLAALEAKAA